MLMTNEESAICNTVKINTRCLEHHILLNITFCLVLGHANLANCRRLFYYKHNITYYSVIASEAHFLSRSPCHARKVFVTLAPCQHKLVTHQKRNHVEAGTHRIRGERNVANGVVGIQEKVCWLSEFVELVDVILRIRNVQPHLAHVIFGQATSKGKDQSQATRKAIGDCDAISTDCNHFYVGLIKLGEVAIDFLKHHCEKYDC